MITDKISLRNIKNIGALDVDFTFDENRIIVITGRNGVGKTTLVKALYLIHDPSIFTKTSPLNSIRLDSKVQVEIEGLSSFTFRYNQKIKALDSRDKLPPRKYVTAEQSIPYGKRFERYSQVASYDSEIRDNIAASNYKQVADLIDFLNQIYGSEKFSN